MEKKNKKGEQKETKGGSKLKIVIITIVAMLVIGAGGYFGYNLFWSQKGQTKQTAKIQQQVPIQQGTASQQNLNYIQQTVSANTYSLDDFLVNLADEGGQRYLKVTIFVGYDNKKLNSELDSKKPILRDAVISVLTTKKAADITPKGIQNIKTELIQRINPMLTKGQIDNIYFDNILVQ